MLLHKDPKRMAAMIVLGKGEPGSYDDMKKGNSEMNQNVPKEAEDYSKGLEAAAEDVLSAIEKKDASALASALHHAFTMCSEME